MTMTPGCGRPEDEAHLWESVTVAHPGDAARAVYYQRPRVRSDRKSSMGERQRGDCGAGVAEFFDIGCSRRGLPPSIEDTTDRYGCRPTVFSDGTIQRSLHDELQGLVSHCHRGDRGGYSEGVNARNSH